MHAVFIPYGIKQSMDHLFMDMQAQKFLMPMYKGKEKGQIYVQGSLRLLPFGVYEYVFPKEHKDAVLTTLGFDKKNYPQYKYKTLPIVSILRKILSCKKIPKFNTDNKYLWVREHVSLIPVGIREDGEILEQKGEYAGFTHEAL